MTSTFSIPNIGGAHLGEVTPTEICSFVTLACLLEASAPKPGNIAPGRSFRDMGYEDFLASAVAIGPVLSQAGQRPLGETIRDAVAETHRWSRANTNLGMILLLAPLARAALSGLSGPLRDRLGTVLDVTTVADAIHVYSAIREAAPGGLGTVKSQDLSRTPTVTLVEAMRLATDRDTIASEYATGFALTFETGVTALRAAREAGLLWRDAVVETYLTLLASRPDTLIARKLGLDAAEEVSARAAEIRRLGGVRTEAGCTALAAFDADLRNPQNSRNPGTTADLTAAAIFVVLVEDGWRPDR
jgi:triphosphoribosyl-dephospho-CoA synthase